MRVAVEDVRTGRISDARSRLQTATKIAPEFLPAAQLLRQIEGQSGDSR